MAGNALGLGAFERVKDPSNPFDIPKTYSKVFYNDGKTFGWFAFGKWQTNKVDGSRGLPDNYRLIAPPNLWRW